MNMLERFDPRSPSYDEKPIILRIQRAISDLQCDPVAVGCARVAGAALAVGKGENPPSYAILDAYNLVKESLDDLIYEAAVSNDLERAQLPATSVIIAILSANITQHTEQSK